MQCSERSGFDTLRAVMRKPTHNPNPSSAAINQRFGKVIREHRRALGLTQTALAAVSKVDRSYLSQLENGRVSPTLEIVFRLAHGLGTAPSSLIGELTI